MWQLVRFLGCGVSETEEAGGGQIGHSRYVILGAWTSSSWLAEHRSEGSEMIFQTFKMRFL